MKIMLIVGAIAVFLSFLSRRKRNGLGLKLAFAVIFVFLALRYHYGNDYMAYLDGFNEITANTKIFFTGERWEPGWNFLNLIFKPVGFFAMVAFLSLATCVVFYRFVRDYVPVQYQWLAVFLYVFDPYQILVPASAMRQDVAILIFLIAFRFLYQKRIIPYLLLAGAAATFHKGGIVLPLLVLLGFINIKINKIVAVGICFLFVSLFLFSQTIFSYFGAFIGAYFSGYAEEYMYRGGATFTTGLGFVYSLFLLISVLYFAGIEFRQYAGSPEDAEMLLEGEDDLLPADQDGWQIDIRARRMLFMLAIITFMFTPLSTQIAMISRINMFFTPFTIAVYPIIVFTTRNKFFKLMFLGSLIPFTLFRFWAFFLSPVWRIGFGTYQTIFSAPQWY